jgi:hypothetical protein
MKIKDFIKRWFFNVVVNLVSFAQSIRGGLQLAMAHITL